MIDMTPIARLCLARRVEASRQWNERLEDVQRGELRRMLAMARRTEWGRRHGYGDINSYEVYRERVDVSDYASLRPSVMRMIAGERDVLWPGVTRRFAQSSGTSDGKSKYIPVTAESLKRSHYRGGGDVVAHYLHNNPTSRLFSGKGLILGGSYANELPAELAARARVGDLSATLINDINPLANLYRTPSKRVALMADWHEKLPALVEATIGKDVTNLSGVPSWLLTVLREVLKRSGASTIHEVWPNLEVFFHGGISFGPYREQYDAIIDPSRMKYMETYNASEGFFALQDAGRDDGMLLLQDAGTFYEFVEVDAEGAGPIPAWEVEQGHIYALIISSCNGLWRYPLGDTVRVESTRPLRISIAGRTKHYINAFGEEVMVYNTDAALMAACHATGEKVLNYTAAPVYTSGGNRGRHQWLIEFAEPPRDIERFADELDLALTRENSDYQAKRAGNIFLDRLSIVQARPGLFDLWLESTGKLGGQRKVPRLSNDRKLMEQMLKFNG